MQYGNGLYLLRFCVNRYLNRPGNLRFNKVAKWYAAQESDTTMLKDDIKLVTK